MKNNALLNRSTGIMCQGYSYNCQRRMHFPYGEGSNQNQNEHETTLFCAWEQHR